MIGVCALVSIPFVLGLITDFKWVETTGDTGTDLAALPDDGVVALCGASNCTELTPGNVIFLGTGGTWTRQLMQCEDTASIECEQPILQGTDNGQDSTFTYEVQFEQHESGTEFLTKLSVQVSITFSCGRRYTATRTSKVCRSR